MATLSSYPSRVVTTPGSGPLPPNTGSCLPRSVARPFPQGRVSTDGRRGRRSGGEFRGHDSVDWNNIKHATLADRVPGNLYLMVLGYRNASPSFTFTGFSRLVLVIEFRRLGDAFVSESDSRDDMRSTSSFLSLISASEHSTSSLHTFSSFFVVSFFFRNTRDVLIDTGPTTLPPFHKTKEEFQRETKQGSKTRHEKRT